MTVSRPIMAWVAALLSNAGVAQSSSLTVTVHITAGWEVQLPVQCRFSNVSSDPVIEVYPSMDGGATYDTTPMTAFSIARIASGTAQASIVLPTGQYALRILNSGPNSASFWVNTARFITAIENV